MSDEERWTTDSKSRRAEATATLRIPVTRQPLYFVSRCNNGLIWIVCHAALCRANALQMHADV